MHIRRETRTSAHNITVAALLVAAVLTTAACDSGPPTPDGVIRVRNDTLDSSYNTITVSGDGISTSLAPGEYIDLHPGTTRFTLTRAYESRTRRYVVSCPSGMKKGVQIKMIDAHTNRMAGGCETVEGG